MFAAPPPPWGGAAPYGLFGQADSVQVTGVAGAASGSARSGWTSKARSLAGSMVIVGGDVEKSTDVSRMISDGAVERASTRRSMIVEGSWKLPQAAAVSASVSVSVC